MLMTREKRPSRSRTLEASPPLVHGSAAAFENLAAALQILSEACPPRMSVRQVLAFAIIAYGNAMGKKLSLADVREAAGEGLGQSIEKTIWAFFEPSPKEPDGLGWLEQEADPDDARRKYLILTDKGRYIVNEMTRALAH